MVNNVIQVEGVSKQYRLGIVGTGTLSHDINRWWHLVRGKEDPYLKVGDENERTTIGSSEYIWALRDVNFNVRDGEILGIVGRNGAGKSTLLKLLSRTTAPTLGTIKVKGKIASLLEVGTGFHPELSGRDNIFLNGAILGMSRKEVKSKFDEIVAFAGVERYIDTPVKRYSSGMYVRLAFAVAAHLEPDILIVDEVLAVGDAEFQKKCLGKMKDVSKNQGRTVIFVSHNMTAIKNLCNSVAFMKNGRVVSVGPTDEIINTYLTENATTSMKQEFSSPDMAPGNEAIKVKKIEVVPILNSPNEPITVHTPLDVEFEFWNYVPDKPINLSMHLYTVNNECVFNVGTESILMSKGLHKGVCRIPSNLLNDGSYNISMMVVAERSYPLFHFENAVSFEIHENRAASGWHGRRPGFVRPQLDFTLA